MNIYRCSTCDNEVKKGTKYCSECGAKLEWPTEKKVKKAKTSSRNEIKLNVDPEVVKELNEDSPGLAICILLFGGFGLIVGTIILFKRNIIKRWLEHLQSPNYYPSIKTETMLKKVETISSCCSWAIAGNILFGIVKLGQLMSASNNASSTSNSFGKTEDTGINILLLILHVVGLLVGFTLKAKADKVTQSALSGNTYTYKRSVLNDKENYRSTSGDDSDEFETMEEDI